MAYSPWFYLLMVCVFFPLAQDAGLDALAAVISRQKQMGWEIGNELDEHNGRIKLKEPD